MTTTTTLTTTIATYAAVGGPAYVPYADDLPHWGLTSIRTVQPAVVSQSVELLGSFLRAWAGLVTHHAEFGNFQTIWGFVGLQ